MSSKLNTYSFPEERNTLIPPNASEDLLEIFHRRYHRGATIIATNRPLEDWGKILGDHAATSAILDRFLEGGHIIKITGRSFRLKGSRKKSEKEKDGQITLKPISFNQARGGRF